MRQGTHIIIIIIFVCVLLFSKGVRSLSEDGETAVIEGEITIKEPAACPMIENSTTTTPEPIREIVSDEVDTDTFTDEDIERGQVREAALRLMVDVAQKVDYAVVPKAVDHLRSAVVVEAINAVGKAYTRFGLEEKETYRDEMTLCAQLAKMFE